MAPLRWRSARSEGLPAAVTITLAIGVSRHGEASRHHPQTARRRDAGQHHRDCSDKTGTLTEKPDDRAASLRRRKILRRDRRAAYEPSGEFQREGSRSKATATWRCWNVSGPGCLCNRFGKSRARGSPRCAGRPHGGRAHRRRTKPAESKPYAHRDWPRVDTIPFDPSTCSTPPLHNRGTYRVIYKVGAFGASCSNAVPTRSDEQGESVPAGQGRRPPRARRTGVRGLRVLASPAAT